MFQEHYLFLVALWLSIFNAESRVHHNDVLPSPVVCMNCTICQYLCHPEAPPPPPSSPLPSYPIYASPPPPPPPQQPSPPLPGYPLYGSPPPPTPLSEYPPYGSTPTPPAQGNCPPFPVQWFGYPPPNPFGYVPYGNYSDASCSPTHFFCVVLLLVLHFAALF